MFPFHPTPADADPQAVLERDNRSFSPCAARRWRCASVTIRRPTRAPCGVDYAAGRLTEVESRAHYLRHPPAVGVDASNRSPALDDDRSRASHGPSCRRRLGRSTPV